MKITDIPRGVLRLQYRIARFPLQLIEQRVIARMDREASARLVYERSFGALDAAVGRALGDAELERRGDALDQRGAALGEAARLDALARQQEAHAVDELRERRERAAATPERAHAIARKRIDQVRAEAAERKQESTSAAAKRTAAAKRKVDDAAARKVSAAEAAKQQAQARATAAERAATAVADAERRDAADKRREAVSKMARADQVEGLADAEKQARRQARR